MSLVSKGGREGGRESVNKSKGVSEQESKYTMEPLNKGHVGTRSFVLYREVSFILRLKCTGIKGIGMSSYVFYKEVSFIGGSTV